MRWHKCLPRESGLMKRFARSCGQRSRSLNDWYQNRCELASCWITQWIWTKTVPINYCSLEM